MKPQLTFAIVAVALLASAFTLVSVQPPTASVVGNELPIEEPDVLSGATLEGGPCPQYAKGGGFGGNHVSCRVVCTGLDFLLLEVQSADTVPVSGNGRCGDATVWCGGHQSCRATSRKMAGRSETGGCEANSDERWKSGLTVNCEPVPGEPCTSPISCTDEEDRQGSGSHGE